MLAWNERRQAIGQSTVTGMSAGDNIQSGALGKAVQDWIATYCGSFVRSHNDDGTARASDYYEGESDIEMWTFPSLMKSVRGGTAQSDFRRATTWPTDWTDWSDAAYSAGRVALGDYFGPWMPPADLQSALNKLIWTKHNAYIVDYTSYIGYGGPDEWTPAKLAAETDWSEGDYPLEDPPPPNCRSIRILWYEGPPAIYESAVQRHNISYGVDLATHCKRTIDWYVMGGLPVFFGGGTGETRTFDDNGDAIAEDVWTNWLTDTPASPAAGEVSSERFGPDDLSTAYPVWCDPPSTEYNETRGYQITSSIAIVRWNISGGFTYC